MSTELIQTTCTPNRIYKYHKVNQYLYDLLINHNLYFAKPHELNDPFDGWIRESENSFKLKWGNYTRNQALKLVESGELGENCIEEFVEKVMAKFMEPELLKKNLQIAHENASFRICCFTDDPLSELMWAHYAEQSRGICLEFDSTLPPLSDKLMRVNYTDETIFSNGGIDVFDVLTTKRRAWNYEKEYRLLAPDFPLYYFDPSTLTGINFGAKCKQEDIQYLRSITTKDKYENISFKKVEINPQTNMMELISIDK